jgi:carboxyl-terminal processing protease
MLPAINRGAGGTFAFPDVCMTPAAPAPLPIPYPNFGLTAMSVPFSPNVLLTFVNAINMSTGLMLTMGDEGGVAHPTFKGAARYSMGNPIVSIHMLPGIMLCALSTGNNMNAPLGANLIPSVTNVFFTRRAVSPTEVQPAASCGLRIAEFEATTPTQVFAELAAREQGIIIDLRGCPGGVTDAALQLADDFLPDRLKLAERVDDDGDVLPVVGRRSQAYHMPVAILVDGMTASAAEIFAGVLQSYGRARLFGAKTYGKAAACKLAVLPEGPRMLQTATFRLANGSSIADCGLEPDVITDAAEEMANAWLTNQK